jgi:hypothetical protein
MLHVESLIHVLKHILYMQYTGRQFVQVIIFFLLNVIIINIKYFKMLV